MLTSIFVLLIFVIVNYKWFCVVHACVVSCGLAINAAGFNMVGYYLGIYRKYCKQKYYKK